MPNKLIWENKNQFAEIINEVIKNKNSLIKTLSDYEKIIIKLSEQYDKDKSNKIKGDMFEVLSAVFFNRMGDSPMVGLNNYETIALEDDYGVDAVGVNARNEKVAVQVKFRSNPSDLILYSDLAKTYTYAVSNRWVSIDDKKFIYLFTNSNGVTPACNKVLENNLVLINRSVLTDYIDNNELFWANFIKYIYNTLSCNI